MSMVKEGEGTPVATAAARSRSGPAPLWLALLATAVGLLLAYLLKSPCIRHPWADSFQYRHLCYNDIQPLFGVRGVSKGLVPYRDVRLEYPVLTGSFMYVAGWILRRIHALVRPSSPGANPVYQSAALLALLALGAAFLIRPGRRLVLKVAGTLLVVGALVGVAVRLGALAENSDRDYFTLTVLLLAPFALAVTLLLRTRVTRGRLMLWAAGTPMVLYAFHNWDLLAVAGAVWGLVELERRRWGLAGVGLALGASAKLFPAFLLPGSLLGRWVVGDREGSWRLALGFGLAAAIVNIPWMLAAPKGWMGVWTFHAHRYPDFGTAWYWVAHHGRRLLPVAGWDPAPAGQQGWYQSAVDVGSLVLFGAGAAWFVWIGWRRRREPGGYPVVAIALGILALFLLTSKVHSPQYALWVVPLLVMLDVPWWLVLAYLGTDLAVYVSGFYFFTVMGAPAPGWKGIFELAVLFRGAALGGLAWWATRARRLWPTGWAGDAQDRRRPDIEYGGARPRPR